MAWTSTVASDSRRGSCRLYIELNDDNDRIVAEIVRRDDGVLVLTPYDLPGVEVPLEWLRSAAIKHDYLDSLEQRVKFYRRDDGERFLMFYGIEDVAIPLDWLCELAEREQDIDSLAQRDGVTS